MIVALKVMDKKKIIQDNLLVQFIRQLKIQSFLDHPNIIKTYGYFADQEHFYTVLELGSDGQLYDVISTGQTLSEDTTSFIVGNLLDAVCLMHKHKILHRDIKPENIVLVHVSLLRFRAMLSCVILGGQSIRSKSFVQLFVERHCTYLHSCYREKDTMRKQIFGQWVYQRMSFIWELRLLISISNRI